MCNKTVEEAWCAFFVVTKCTQDGENTKATLTGNTCACGNVFSWLLFNVELEPLTAVRVNGALDQLMLRQVTQTETLTWFKNNAGRTHELRYNYALGAVDNECSFFRHLREVTHENNLLFNFSGVTV